MSIALHSLSVPEIQALRHSLDSKLCRAVKRLRITRHIMLGVGYTLAVSLSLQPLSEPTWLELLFSMLIALVGIVALFGLGCGHGQAGAAVIGASLGGCIFGAVLGGQGGVFWAVIGVLTGSSLGTFIAYSTGQLLDDLEDNINSLKRQLERVRSHSTQSKTRIVKRRSFHNQP